MTDVVDTGIGLARRQIERVELNEQVYEAVRALLVTDRLSGGQRLSLSQIAEELSVSRSPVHHALTRLVGEGLITVESRRGYFVRKLTVDVVVHAYDVRLALEIGAAEASVGTIPTERLAELRGLLEPTVVAVEDGQLLDKRGYIHANQAFHQCLVDLAGNPLLSSIYARLPVNLLMERILGAGDAEVGPVAEEHVRIVEAFEGSDLAGAVQAIRDHVETGKRVAVRAIERAGGSL
jgi:DNA-binding GntR family transcriptional regulator